MCAAGCVLASTALLTLGRAAHGRVAHVSSTLVVDAAGQRLPGLFDGLPADPRYNVELLTLLQPPQPHCGRGFWQRLLGRMERTAYADSNCGSSSCGYCQGGGYYVGTTNPCNGENAPTCPGTGYDYAYYDPTASDEYTGYNPGCDAACGGGDGCPCPLTACDLVSSPPAPSACQSNNDCASCKYCNSNQQCVAATCSGSLCCHGNSDCTGGWSCNSGCCMPSGGGACASNSGDNCGSCGTVQCDRSSNDTCNN